jgi:carboxymethylenebutenolidase
LTVSRYCSQVTLPRLSAAAPFYGPLPDNADFAGSRNAAVLGVYAELDC